MDVIAMGTFLECLEPYMINDKLQVIPPAVMKDFVTHYETKGLLENVEACIVHMDVASLDIHNVSTVLPAKSDSDIMVCLQTYKGLIINRSLVY